MRSSLERPDGALLSAYLLAAALGTWTSCLLVNDGAVYLTAAWLGDAWDLFFDQNTGRTVSTMFQFGLVWVLRPVFGTSSDAFILAGHAFYFTGPLALWLILRSVEPQPVYSRLYLATTAMMIYFTSEMIAGVGLWLIWLAWLDAAPRPRNATVLVTLSFALVIAFTHPAVALLSLLFALLGGALLLLKRPFPRHLAVAAGAMAVLLLAAYVAITAAFRPSNPTIVLQQGLNKYDYVNPLWMMATLYLFPMLAMVWLLLLAPGLQAARARWRISPMMLVIFAGVGLWFAAAGTGLLTWLYARHTAGHVLALALALALVSPVAWLAAARRPLMLVSAIIAVAALSYNFDLFLFGRFVDRHLEPGVVDVDAAPQAWPRPLSGPYGLRGTFKWAAAPDYQRDVVVPIYDWYRVTLAFYSYFRSDRRSVLFHAVGKPREWVPFECAPVARARALAHDARDDMFLAFLAQRYCVR